MTEDWGELWTQLAEQPFEIPTDVSGLNDEECELLRQWGTRLNALYQGHIDPRSEKQRQFLEEVRSKRPSCRSAVIWLKYLQGLAASMPSLPLAEEELDDEALLRQLEAGLNNLFGRRMGNGSPDRSWDPHDPREDLDANRTYFDPDDGNVKYRDEPPSHYAH